jgi:hypothetical protein
MHARLDDRVAEPGLVITVLLAVAVALYLAFAGCLIAVDVADGGARHIPAVTVDNQTHLTLDVELVDRQGARLTLGAHKPGSTSRFQVADVGRSWTFEAYYGNRRIDQQTLDRDTLARQGWTVHVPATATTDLERAGYR